MDSGVDTLALTDQLLTELAGLLQPLTQALPATHGPRNLLPPTPEQEAARHRVHQAEHDDAEAQQWRVLAARTRAGRAQPQPTWGSTSPIPINVHVSDALGEVTVGVIELYEAVCDTLGITAARVDTTAHRIRHLKACLIAAQDHPTLADHIRAETTRLLRTAHQAVTPPARAYVGRCPDCDQPTLQVDFDTDVITCVNRDCDCGVDTCPCQHGRRHQWHRPDWDRLALRMRATG